MRLGFSYIGLIMLIMLMIPNIVWSKNKPIDYEKYVVKEKRSLALLEGIGEVLVTIIALIFKDFNIYEIKTRWILILGMAFFFMIIYELYWINYFRSEHRMKDMYRSYMGVPVAGATLPVLAFMLLGIYGKNIFMVVAVIILGIGHIGIHLNHMKDT